MGDGRCATGRRARTRAASRCIELVVARALAHPGRGGDAALRGERAARRARSSSAPRCARSAARIDEFHRATSPRAAPAAPTASAMSAAPRTGGARLRRPRPRPGPASRRAAPPQQRPGPPDVQVPLIDFSEFDPIDSKGYPPTLKTLVEGVQAHGRRHRRRGQDQVPAPDPARPDDPAPTGSMRPTTTSAGACAATRTSRTRPPGAGKNVYDVYTKSQRHGARRHQVPGLVGGGDGSPHAGGAHAQRGFTIIELMVVDRNHRPPRGGRRAEVHPHPAARQGEPRSSTTSRVMRDLIQQYKVDKKKYPESLPSWSRTATCASMPEDLDHRLGRRRWVEVHNEPADPDDPNADTGIVDVKSGAAGQRPRRQAVRGVLTMRLTAARRAAAARSDRARVSCTSRSPASRCSRVLVLIAVSSRPHGAGRRDLGQPGPPRARAGPHLPRRGVQARRSRTTTANGHPPVKLEDLCPKEKANAALHPALLEGPDHRQGVPAHRPGRGRAAPAPTRRSREGRGRRRGAAGRAARAGRGAASGDRRPRAAAPARRRLANVQLRRSPGPGVEASSSTRGQAVRRRRQRQRPTQGFIDVPRTRRLQRVGVRRRAATTAGAGGAAAGRRRRIPGQPPPGEAAADRPTPSAGRRPALAGAATPDARSPRRTGISRLRAGRFHGRSMPGHRRPSRDADERSGRRRRPLADWPAQLPGRGRSAILRRPSRFRGGGISHVRRHRPRGQAVPGRPGRASSASSAWRATRARRSSSPTCGWSSGDGGDRSFGRRRAAPRSWPPSAARPRPEGRSSSRRSAASSIAGRTATGRTSPRSASSGSSRRLGSGESSWHTRRGAAAPATVATRTRSGSASSASAASSSPAARSSCASAGPPSGPGKNVGRGKDDTLFAKDRGRGPVPVASATARTGCTSTPAPAPAAACRSGATSSSTQPSTAASPARASRGILARVQ